MPEPDRGRQVLDADDNADEPVLPRRIVGRAQLERHLMLVAQVDGLDVIARLHVPEMQPVAVLPAEQELRHDPVLDHRRGGPFRGDQDVVVDVPPQVSGEGLVAAVRLELAEYLEAGVVKQRAAAWPLGAVGTAEAGHVQVARSAVDRMRARVAGSHAELLGPEHLDDLRGRWVVLGVENIDAGGADAGHDEVPAGAAVLLAGGAQRAPAGGPTAKMRLVAPAWQL